VARSRGDLTPAGLRALRLLLDLEAREAEEDAEPAEIVCEGLACWIGTRRTSHALANRLLALMLVGEASDEGGLRRLRLTGPGRAAAVRPERAGDAYRALLSGGAFTVVDGEVAALAALNPPGPTRRG
jgi:hypothetical protein